MFKLDVKDCRSLPYQETAKLMENTKLQTEHAAIDDS
jgi:hypothetical protein